MRVGPARDEHDGITVIGVGVLVIALAASLALIRGIIRPDSKPVADDHESQ